MKKEKSHSKRRKRNGSPVGKRTFSEPRSIDDYNAMSVKHQQLSDDIGQIATEVRNGASLNAAARKFRRDPRTVQRWGKGAFRKLRNSRWATRKTDRLFRLLQSATPRGMVEVATNDSRQASALGKHWSAVEVYLDTGDSSKLHEFDGQYVIDADGNQVPLLTDERVLDRLASAGVLSFESLYGRAA